MQYKGELIGSDICVEQTKDIANAFLGGLVPDEIESGLGFVMIYFITKYAQEKGYKRIITGVSSNNFPILKLHEMFGYNVSGMTYCLVKHE